MIRARNKREDRLLNVRVKFYERERNIRLNFLRQEQFQLERVRTSICEEANKVVIKKQNPPVWMSPRPKTGVPLKQIAAPVWMSSRPKTGIPLRQITVPELIFPDWAVNQPEIAAPPPPPIPPPLSISPAKVIRRHSAR